MEAFLAPPPSSEKGPQAQEWETNSEGSTECRAQEA